MFGNEKEQVKAGNASRKGTFGRPRLLSHDEILSCAISIGLDKFTMKQLAAQLGVGTATLYQYFDSRKSLLRAAAIYALADIPWPEDNGQHWSHLARQYMFCLYEFLLAHPSMIISPHHCDYGFEVRFRLVEGFLRAMHKRGLAESEAMRLFNQLAMIAFAGAVEAQRHHEYELRDETLREAALRQFQQAGPGNFPYLAAALESFTASAEQKMDNLLQSVLHFMALEHDEILPPMPANA